MDDLLGQNPSTPDLGANPPDLSQVAEDIIQPVIQPIVNATQVVKPVINAAENVVAAQVGNIQMIAVASSDIAAWGYSPIESQLQIQFTNGRIYVYSNIGPMDFEMLSTAPSKGKAFWTLIRRAPVQHPFTRIQ